MRPLTLHRLLLQCLLLLAILFFVVILALKFGAVPVSLYALGRDLLRVLFGQSSGISSDYGLIIVNIRLPRILLGIIVGASLSVAGTSFQALLRNPLADPYVLGVSSVAHSVGRFSRSGRDHHRSLFSRPPPRADRQQHTPSRWRHHRLLPFGHHYVSNEHPYRQSPRPGVLAHG